MDSLERRDQILTAARALLAEPNGRRALTVGRVAARAGVGRATVYRYFPDRAALFAAATGADDPARAGPRAQILEAALSVFAERGIHAATLSQIAARAGLSLSGLHWHFRNKDEIIAGIAQHVPLFASVAKESELAGRADTDLEGQLGHIAEALLESMERLRGVARLALFEAAIYPDVAKLAKSYTIGRVLPMLRELFEEHARRGNLRPGSAQVRAQAFISLLAMLILLRPAFDELLADDDRETVREYVQIFVHGIAATPEGD